MTGARGSAGGGNAVRANEGWPPTRRGRRGGSSGAARASGVRPTAERAEPKTAPSAGASRRHLPPKARRLVVRLRAQPAPDPRRQLDRSGAGLDQVIEGTSGEGPAQHLGLAVVRQHDDRYGRQPGVLAHPLENGEALDLGEEDVQQDQVWTRGADQVQARGPVAG